MTGMQTSAVTQGSETARAYERQLDGDTIEASQILSPKIDRANKALSQRRIFSALSQGGEEEVASGMR